MTRQIPKTPEECLAECAHLFPDQQTQDSYGNLLYRQTLLKIELLVLERVKEAVIQAFEECSTAVDKILSAHVAKDHES